MVFLRLSSQSQHVFKIIVNIKLHPWWHAGMWSGVEFSGCTSIISNVQLHMSIHVRSQRQWQDSVTWLWVNSISVPLFLVIAEPVGAAQCDVNEERRRVTMMMCDIWYSTLLCCRKLTIFTTPSQSKNILWRL